MILVINAGSSNVKFAIYDEHTFTQVCCDQVPTIQDAITWLNTNSDKYSISSVGHRIVHGGSKFFEPIILDNNVLNQLKQFIPLAPLHQPHNIAAVEFLMKMFPNIPQVGCFDTAFHRTQHPIAKQFAIPSELAAEGVIRYGFHGLSYEYIASVLAENIGDIANKKVIVAHLGNGASMCAMDDLKSVATSMGFSALDGLMMGTRCGTIDPGVLLYLLQEKKLSPDELSSFLYNSCGLLGVSNISNDMRELLQNNSQPAQDAIDLFCYKAACEFGSLLAALQGCSALIFTAGIGENSAPVRERICNWLTWLGIKIDQIANVQHKSVISTNDSKILIGVIKTDEEYIIAKHVAELVKSNI